MKKNPLLAVLVVSFGAALGGCDTIDSIELFDSKKKLPGDRKSVFPEGVPGYELCPLVQEQAMAAGAEFSLDEVTALEPEGERWRLATPGDERESLRRFDRRS